MRQSCRVGFAALLMAALWTGVARGEVRLWDGGGGGDWFDANNWDPNGRPDPADELTVEFGSPTTDVEVRTAGGGGITLIGQQASASLADLVVGHAGSGTVRVAGGASLWGQYGHVGGQADGNGTVCVEGRAEDNTASAWTNSGWLAVGHEGAGVLDVLDGGQVWNTYAYIGFDTDVRGAVTVAGAGSKWTSSADLTVGEWGVGTLAIRDGGAVVNREARVGSDRDANGTVEISGPEATWTCKDVAYLAHGSATVGSVSVTGSGALWTCNSFARVGNKGVGSVRVADGGTFSVRGVNIGFGSGANGSVRVDGCGADGAPSTLDNSGDMYVGDWGRGTLEVYGGAVVTGAEVHIASGRYADGTATIDGNGSQWTCRQALYVAHEGVGALTVRGGGLVSSRTGTVGYHADANGVVVVEGACAEGTASTWSSSGTLRVACSGLGSLTVRDGGTVACADGIIGENASGRGVVVVEGDGSRWDPVGNLQVARSGEGSLTVRDGGGVSNFVGYVGSREGSVGEATVQGRGAVWRSLSDLFVGQSGGGTLAVRDGGRVASSVGYVGYGETADGEVTVEGAGADGNGAAWEMSGSLYVGFSGSGRLTVRGGGSVTCQYSEIGYHAGGGAEVTVEGGGCWAGDGPLVVARDGTATLTVRDGGAVSNGMCVIADGLGGDGTVTVEGSGSRWDSAGAVHVGQAGTGHVYVRDGGAAAGASGYIAVGIDSNGAVSVEGEGASWSVIDELSVGDWGVGTLDVRGGGRVTGHTGYVGYGIDANGSATVEGPDSAWVSSGCLYVGGSDVFPGGLGELSVLGGTVRVGETLKLWPPGRVRLAEGTLDANAVVLEPGASLAFTGGRLVAAGFRGDLLDEGGSICPGRPVGPLSVDGNCTLDLAASLSIELGAGERGGQPAAGEATYDRLATTGRITLAGTLRLAWAAVPGDPNSKFGGAYHVVTSRGGLEGAFDSVQPAFGEAYLAGIEDCVDLFGDGSVLAVRVVLHDLLDGDADLDGDVDRGDFLALRGGFGAAGEAAWAWGDFDLDGEVDGLDYVMLKRGFGASVPAPAGVPEPGALALLAVGGAWLARRGGRRRRGITCA